MVLVDFLGWAWWVALAHYDTGEFFYNGVILFDSFCPPELTF